MRTVARTGVRRAAWVLLAIATGVVGYLAGSSQQIKATTQSLQIEAAGNLTQRVETLSLLRMGDLSGAITRLEGEADRLTVSIAANAGADQHVLAYMKTYLSVAPPSPSRAKELSSALEGVPVLEPAKCNSALRALLLSTKGGPAEQRK